MTPALSILERLCTDVFKHLQLSYFIMDKTGIITQWGGNLSTLNMTPPKKYSHITDVVLFMSGILPLASDALEFSCIKMEPGICVDAHLFKTENGYALILWDATEKEAFLTETQQQCNELSLFIEEQKNKVIQREKKHETAASLKFLEGLFLALNFAVLEMNDEGHFVLLGTPPLWVSQLPQSGQLLSGSTCEEDVFSFLGNFIQEAKNRWRKKPTETFKSGIWIERDHTGQEFLFEATGIAVQDKKLLIIATDVCDPNEKQSLIQKGRDLALHYHELQRSDNELRNMHDELEERVRERTKDLEQANQRLAGELKQRKQIEKEREEVAKQLRQSRKMEAIGTLAGGIAHDFNNILSAIMGFTELSLLDAQDHPTLKPKLKKILHASDRAKELVRQILTFSRQSDYEKRPLKLRLVVKEALNLLRASLPAFIEIKQKLSSNTYILADPTQIHQVVMNLCTNAWHAMQESGGILSVETREMIVTEQDMAVTPELSEGKYICLSVKDTGCGIPEEVMDRIFDPYFTTKDKNKGTGLGLSMVHGIVSNANGFIQVSTQKDKGSEFKILLPVFESREEAQPEKQSLPTGNNEHILFVDDEIYQTQMTEELINNLGYKVTTCNDSLQALGRFMDAPDKFDLVITDMIMPKMKGNTLAEKIHAARTDIPIILCSGYSDEINPDTIEAKGISKYLMKPVGINNLAVAIKEVLQNSSA